VQKKIQSYLFICLGALFLIWPALYNQYPIVHSDSGTYIRHGFNGLIAIDRPVMYSLFIKYSSLNVSLWLTVFTQGILISYGIFYVVRLILGANKHLHLQFLFIVILLSGLTGISWYCSQIMADVFTPIFILSTVSILLDQSMTRKKLFFFSALYIISLCSHLSNGIIATCFILLIGIFKLISRSSFKIISFKALLFLLALNVCSYFTVCTINYTHHDGFNYSKGSHAFLMAHFIESGYMKAYLQEHCNDIELKDCKMCQYKDSLENSLEPFLWNYPNSTLYKTGGWDHTSNEYVFLFKKMLSSPDYLIKNLFFSLGYGFKQLSLNAVGDGLWACGADSPGGSEIQKHYPSEYPIFLKSKQGNDPAFFKLIETISSFQNIILCILLITMIFLWCKLNTHINMMFICLALFVIINSLVTAGLNSTFARFQARVSWLLVLSIILMAIVHFKNKKTFIPYICINFIKKND
jgi:hypothetical protein